MRIALVNVSFEAGRGSDQVVIELGQRLEKEHKVTLFSFKPAKRENLNMEVVSPEGPGFGSLIRFIFYVRRALLGYDVVNCHHAIISLILPRENLLTTYHGFRGRINLRIGQTVGELISRSVRRLLIRPALFRSRAVAIVSRSLEAEASLSRTQSLRVIYNGVSPLTQIDIPGSPGHFLYVGRLDPDKNVRKLLEIYRSVGNLPKLFVAGDGIERGDLERDFSDGSIHFLGRMNHADLANLYSRAHAFVTTSAFETFCLPVIEAASLGCPSIGCRSGSLPEVISEGRTGWLADDFAREGPELLRKAAALSPEQREAIGRDCREWAARFSWDNALQQYCALYAEIAAGPAR